MSDYPNDASLPLIRAGSLGNRLFPWLDNEKIAKLNGDDGYYTRRALAETRTVAALISICIAGIGLAISIASQAARIATQ